MSIIARRLFVITVGCWLAACAATPGKVSQTEPVPPINTRDAIALKGYDPVAYFLDGKPQSGDATYSYRWQDVTWQFASSQHRDAFAADPTRYAPQFGGYCAFAVSRGMIADIDPDQWAIVDHKLYLNNNAFAHKLWNQDRTGNIAAGNVNWPLIPKK